LLPPQVSSFMPTITGPTIKGKTQLLGVIGDPVAHSLSPLMHNAAIATLGLDYVYVPFAIKPENLAAAIAGFEAIGVRGFSITIPHKQAIIPYLSEITDKAKLVGAVNTVWRTATGWSGTNTDVEGFISPLKDLDRDWSAITPVILGHGGAARAVIVGLLEMGCPDVKIIGRNPDKLSQFQQSWANTPLENKIKVYSWENLSQLLPQSELLVNTTPVGMAPHRDRSPVEAALWKSLAQNAIAYDLIYTPNPTLFLAQAQEQGAIIIDGLEMLVQQGAAALQIWLNQPVPVAVMRQRLRQQLGL
jgi:shikimate dehydrogenase